MHNEYFIHANQFEEKLNEPFLGISPSLQVWCQCYTKVSPIYHLPSDLFMSRKIYQIPKKMSFKEITLFLQVTILTAKSKFSTKGIYTLQCVVNKKINKMSFSNYKGHPPFFTQSMQIISTCFKKFLRLFWQYSVNW